MSSDRDREREIEETNEKFWDIILQSLTEHDLFMFGFLADKAWGNSVSVGIFNWEDPEYEMDFRDPPEFSL